MTQHIRIGTRGSALARWQAEHIAMLLKRTSDVMTEQVAITTQGDRDTDTPLPEIGGKGVFTEEIEASLRSGEVDIAVHSLKDLPVEEPDGIVIGAIPARGSARDVLISRDGLTLSELARGAAVGTSSTRRAAQLLRARPDLRIIALRGNIDTRVRKAIDPDGPYDAIVLAEAGLRRLGIGRAAHEIDPVIILPAPGQGALAVQCRADDAETRKLLWEIDNPASRAAVTAERAFLHKLGSGCALPVAAYAQLIDGKLTLHGRVIAPDGSRQLDGVAVGRSGDDGALGTLLADQLLWQGAETLLGES